MFISNIALTITFGQIEIFIKSCNIALIICCNPLFYMKKNPMTPILFMITPRIRKKMKAPLMFGLHSAISSLCHRPSNYNSSDLCGFCKSLAPEIVRWLRGISAPLFVQNVS